jgi:hypothetical protein
VTDIDCKQEQSNAAPRLAAVPAVGAPRHGNFWQRWKEWERANGTVPTPARDRAA